MDAFDVLHVGHVRLLGCAKTYGDRLIVSIAGDEHVRWAKGPNRPINTQEDRAEVLSQLRAVDEVVAIVNYPGHAGVCEMVRRICPDVYVKGDDWKDKYFAERDVLLEQGSKIVFIPLWLGHSSSRAIKIISADLEV